MDNCLKNLFSFRPLVVSVEICVAGVAIIVAVVVEAIEAVVAMVASVVVIEPLIEMGRIQPGHVNTRFVNEATKDS